MFELPEAKRVRRSDLYARSQSSSPAPSEPDPELEAQLQARLNALYGSALDITPSNIATASAQTQSKPDAQDDADEEEAPEFEFRLFSSGKDDKAEPQKIVLQVEEEEVGEGGLVVPNRNPKYYFAEKAVGEQKWRFEAAALSGEEVLEFSRRRAWGLEVPWRVRVLKVEGKVKRDEAGLGDETKRKRPGKKRRLILRRRKVKRTEMAEKRKMEQDLKEEAEKEKRTRRNREKKVKKKMREKAKKAEAAGRTTDGAEGGGGTISPSAEASG